MTGPPKQFADPNIGSNQGTLVLKGTSLLTEGSERSVATILFDPKYRRAFQVL